MGLREEPVAIDEESSVCIYFEDLWRIIGDYRVRYLAGRRQMRNVIITKRRDYKIYYLTLLYDIRFYDYSI